MAIKFSKEDQEKLKNDNSEIYQKRTEETNQQDIKNLKGKEKWTHFKDYYLKSVIIAVIVVCFIVVSIVQSIVNQETPALYIAIQGDAFLDENVEAFEEAIGKYLKLGDKEVVLVDTACDDQKLQTYLYAGTIDIYIAPDEVFKRWASSEYFCSSNKHKDVAFYKDIDEKYHYSTQYLTSEDILSNKEDTNYVPSDKTMYQCGLYLTDSKKYRMLGGSVKKPVLGISTTTEHMQEAKEFVQFMMDNSRELKMEVNAE